VAYASGAVGVIVAVNVPALYDTFEGTLVAPAVNVYEIVEAWTASLNVAVGAVVVGWSTAPLRGVVDTTDGGVLSAVVAAPEGVARAVVMPSAATAACRGR
jgi:hypothetical protein